MHAVSDEVFSFDGTVVVDQKKKTKTFHHQASPPLLSRLTSKIRSIAFSGVCGVGSYILASIIAYFIG
jgi:hypothetical protein